MHRSTIEYEDVLRRLTLNDEGFVRDVMVGRAPGHDRTLDGRTRELVRLGALIALDAGDAAIDAKVATALAAGASRWDVVDVLLSVGPSVGSARLVGIAPRIAAAMGFDVYAALEAMDTRVEARATWPTSEEVT